jgi:hypothetical protein
MTVSYALFENHVSPSGGTYRAAIQSVGRVELDGVIDRMLERSSTITRADALAVLEEYFGAIESLVLEGFKVVTPSAVYGVSIKGVFDSAADGYDSSRHSIEPSVSAGAQFRRAVRERAQVQKAEATKPRPNPVEFIDTNTGRRNSILTPGGMAQLLGHRLKFDLNDPAQGIFFTHVGNGDTPVRAEVVGKNLPSEIMFLVPAALPDGDYALTIKAQFGDEMRAGGLEEILTVG